MKNGKFHNWETAPSFKIVENFITRTSAHAYWKDLKGNYVGCNPLMLQANGMQSEHELIGKTDLELFGQKHAPVLMKNDREVCQRDKSNTYIELAQEYNNYAESHRYLSYKAPIRSQHGKMMGIFGLSFLLNGEDSLFTALSEISSLINPGIFENLLKQTSNRVPTCLSKQQTECLYFLVKGMSCKQIANMLGLSHRTVERYLDTVKLKLNCYNKSELIAAALEIPMIKNRL